MRPAIITVSGMPRSGKDTLIKHMLKSVQTYEEGGAQAIHHSSVDLPKEFQKQVKMNLGIPITPNLEGNDREFLAQIKSTMDKFYSWTAMRPVYLINSLEYHTVFYQVREAENLNELQAECILRNWIFIAIYVEREDRPSTEMAFTDHLRSDGFGFDFVIKSRLDTVEAEAERVVKELNNRRRQGPQHGNVQ